MNKLTILIKTHLLYYTRNRSVIVGAIIFPLMFIGVFGIAFQYGEPGTESIEIGIINNDTGVPTDSIIPTEEGNQFTGNVLSESFLQILSEITFEDNKTNIFELHYYSQDKEDQAIDELNKREIMALLYLPTDFSIGYMAEFRTYFENNPLMTNLTNNWTGYPTNSYSTSLRLLGDRALQSFAIAASVLEKVTNAFFTIGTDPFGGTSLEIEGTVDSKGFTIFDYILPGLVIFALMNTLGVVASIALRDVTTGLLDRLRISNFTPKEYTISLIIGQLIISLVQIPIMFGTGILFGFPLTGQIGIAFIMAILISLAMSGIGLLVAGLVNSQTGAGSASLMIATPMAFLASAFFIVPNPTIIHSGGIFGANEFGVMDILPPSLAIEALRLILLSGKTIGELTYYFIAMTVISIFYLLIGIFVYSRKHLSPK